MSTITLEDRVGDVVAQKPSLSRVFEAHGVGYCCSGKKTIGDVCRERGVDPDAFVEQLGTASSTPNPQDETFDPLSVSLTDLADHIEQTHHAYLRSELPRLGAMTNRVSTVHGGKDPRLAAVDQTFRALAEELASHMMKEERILFPMIRQLEASDAAPAFHCGSLANPINQMEAEHSGADGALERLGELTDAYAPPDWACNTYRAMLDGLQTLEADMHRHIHKENNVLFPRALEMESSRSGTEASA